MAIVACVVVALSVTLRVGAVGHASPASRGAAQTAGATVAPVDSTIVSLEFDHAFSDEMPALAVVHADGMDATIFAMSGRVGLPGYQTAAQLLAWQDEGDEIGGHTIDHPDLSLISDADQQCEICGDRLALSGMGLQVEDFAYPYGHAGADTAAIARGCGYLSARGTGGLSSPGGCYGPCPPAETLPPVNPFLTRTVNSVITTTTLATIEGYVTAAERYGGGWLQIVFHHVCDGCDLYSVSLPTLTAFLTWLQARRTQGTIVETVRQALTTIFAPGGVELRRGTARLRLWPATICPLAGGCRAGDRHGQSVRLAPGQTLIVTTEHPATAVGLTVHVRGRTGSPRVEGRRRDAGGLAWLLKVPRALAPGPAAVTAQFGRFGSASYILRVSRSAA